jgi:hypothetical protein
LFSIFHFFYPPIITVGQPRVIVPPCAVWSPCLAAGLLPIITVAEPLMIESGGPVQVHISPIVAAGIPPINTVGVPGGSIGPPTCGGAGGTTNGHTCMSPTLAANGIFIFLINVYHSSF